MEVGCHTCTAQAMQCMTRPYHAASFGWWVVTAAILPAHLTLLLQQGQRLAGVEQSQVAQALCHHVAALLLCFTAAEQQMRHLQSHGCLSRGRRQAAVQYSRSCRTMLQTYVGLKTMLCCKQVVGLRQRQGDNPVQYHRVSMPCGSGVRRLSTRLLVNADWHHCPAMTRAHGHQQPCREVVRV